MLSGPFAPLVVVGAIIVVAGTGGAAEEILEPISQDASLHNDMNLLDTYSYEIM